MTHQLPETELLDCATANSEAGQVMVAFATSSYLDLALNWALSLEQVGVRNRMIVSLDGETHRFLSERGFSSVCAPPRSGSLAELRLLRLRVVELLVRSGLDVVHSDVDLAWLRDPRPEHFGKDACSLVASQGSLWPPVAHGEWGFVLCSGLFFLRSETGTLGLIHRWLEVLEGLGSDQAALNEVLLAHGASWRTEGASPYFLDHRGWRVKCYRETLEGCVPSLDITLALLPHHLFRRLPVAEPGAISVHPLAERGGTRQEALEAAGCWFLRPDWRRIRFDVDSLDACRL